MTKLIDILLKNLPTASDIDYTQLLYKDNGEFSFRSGIYYKNKKLIIKCPFIPSSHRGVDLKITQDLEKLQEYIVQVSSVPFHNDGIMDFNLNCPIYEDSIHGDFSEISHLPTECLEWFIEDHNNFAIITPALYEDYNAEETESEEENRVWQWNVLAIRLYQH